MRKYVDAERLKAEIVEIYNEGYKFLPSDIVEVLQDFEDDVLRAIDDIDSLQMEQPEVDFEKEYKDWWENKVSGNVNIKHTMEWYLHETARHFAEWGAEHLKK